jgi:hypothetical protein
LIEAEDDDKYGSAGGDNALVQCEKDNLQQLRSSGRSLAMASTFR